MLPGPSGRAGFLLPLPLAPDPFFDLAVIDYLGQIDTYDIHVEPNAQIDLSDSTGTISSITAADAATKLNKNPFFVTVAGSKALVGSNFIADIAITVFEVDVSGAPVPFPDHVIFGNFDAGSGDIATINGSGDIEMQLSVLDMNLLFSPGVFDPTVLLTPFFLRGL